MGLPTLVEFVEITIATTLAYNIGLTIYRLYFHPLAKFPGPKLTAISQWYEIYYDLVKEGQFMFEIERMHKQYGPIVRINPDELHINDPEFFDEIYSSGLKKRDRYEKWRHMAGAPNSTFSTTGHDFHRRRRAALNPFFAKRSVVRLEQRISDKVAILCDRFAKEMEKGNVIDIHTPYVALTTDIITDYCYGYSYDYLLKEDFGYEWKVAIVQIFKDVAFRRAVPWVMRVFPLLPRRLIVALMPRAEGPFAFQADIEKEITKIFSHELGDDGKKGTEKESIFTTLRDSDVLPEEEKSIKRMTEEGFTLIGAGAETTAKTLAETTFHVLNTPGVLSRLSEELKTVMPKNTDMPSWTELEKLPYMNGVVMEGLRLMLGVTTRIPRLPHEPLKYGDWVIPAWTPVSETTYFVHTNPDIFPEPEKFKPERWIYNDGDKRLERYMTTFNKGTRICLGMNLAYAEIFLALAAVFRRFDMEVVGTTIDDIKMAKDCFMAHPKEGSQAIKVLIKGEIE